MENEDNMMEEMQPVGQPEAAPDITVDESMPEIEPVEPEQDPEPQEAPEEDTWTKCRQWLAGCWEKVKDFLQKRKQLVIIALLVIVALLVVLFVVKRNNDKKYRYETLGQTITEMKRISEFCTANYIGEVMIQDEENQLLKKKNIVLIVRGKIRMGFDLTKMETQVVNDSTINLTLPGVQILDIITNPSDIRTFSEKGTWSHERVTITKNSARAKLLELVMEENLLATAEENGKRQLSSIFSSFGFKHVNIAIAVDSTACDTLSMVGDSISDNATTLFVN